MNQLIKTLLTALLGIAVLSGCGGSSSSDPDPDPDPTPTPTLKELLISGSAIKGVIKSGNVSIYGVTNGVKDSTPLITGVTGPDGSYSLTVEDYEGPVVVEITAGAASTMVCDVIGGCDGVAFGEDVSLPSDFELKAVVPVVEDGDSVTTNVTALTSLAAELAEDAGIDAAQVADANSQVAALFNITGDLTELEVVDITDSSALAAAGGEAQEAAILNAALLTAALADAAAGETIADVLNGIAEDFVANQGQLVQNESSDTSAVTMAEILESSLTIIADPVLADVDLGALETTTGILLEEAESAPPGEVTQVEPTTPEEEDDTAAAKAMVDGLRIFGLAATYEGSSEAGFLDEFGMATDLISDVDVDTIFDSLEPISQILVTAFEANMMAIESGQDPLTSFDFPILDELTGTVLHTVTVTITPATTGDTYSIDDTVPDTVTQTVPLEVDIAATFSLVQDEVVNESQDPTTGESTEIGTFDLVADLSLTGSISTTNVAMTLTSGSVSVDMGADWNESWLETEEEFTETFDETITATLLSVDLDVTLAQLTGTMPISFTGALGITLTNAEADFDETFTWGCDLIDAPEGAVSCEGGTDDGVDTITLDELDLSLNGTFSKGTESFMATVEVNVDPDPAQHNVTDTWNDEWVDFYDGQGLWLGGDYNFMSDGGLNGETEQSFIGVALVMVFDFNLDGVDESTGVNFEAQRTGLEAVDATLELEVGSNRLLLEASAVQDDLELVVTDQNSNTLTVTEVYDEVMDEFMVSGHIMVDGEEVATIAEEEGVVIIRYADGTLESL